MSKLVVILGFLVSFAAGLWVGWRVVSPLHPARAGHASAEQGKGVPPATQSSGPRGPRDPRGWLTEVLKLTPEQQAQMHDIWDDPARQGRREQDERRQLLRKARDESVTKLLTETGKKDEFDRINADFAKGNQALDAEWRGRFVAAVERTKAILTDEQRKKYEEIMSRHAPGPNGTQPGQRGGGGTDNERISGRRPETRATSRPDRQDPPTSR
jgi:Spy/CpxP family protein refolding chaperone